MFSRSPCRRVAHVLEHSFADEETIADSIRLCRCDGSPRSGKTVNDGVMGGRSDGRFRIAKERSMEFFGTLSLENNGGFASVRSRHQKTRAPEIGDSPLLPASKGMVDDTRSIYTFPLVALLILTDSSSTPRRINGSEVRVPLKKFVATSFGRIVSNAGPVNPEQVNFNWLLAR